MGWFGRRREEDTRPQPVVTVNGGPLRCQVCGYGEFRHRRAQLNTATATFFNFDWANPSADCFICDDCGYVHWFLNRR